MCGIVGFSGDKDADLLSSMLACVAHRGRDEAIQSFPKGMNLGMNRLAVIDLSKHLYPMRYKNYWMIFNGEIYNYRELRHRLSQRGIRFQTTSDAEVILPLFDLYGVDALSKLEGMFALSIFDEHKNTLLLARDKAGEKPLYYAQNRYGVFFASELKSLLATKRVSRELNTHSLADFFYYGSLESEKTFLADVQRVRPSGYIQFDLNRGRKKNGRYWRFPRGSKSVVRTFSESLEILDALLRVSVQARTRADVEIGSFLSGGVDSSLLTYYAKLFHPTLRTFSVSFLDSAWSDESGYSRQVASFLGTNHTVVPCAANNLTTVVTHIGRYLDEPVVDPAALPTYLLAQKASQHLKVVLSGVGADELFGGYYRHLLRFLQGTPLRMLRFLQHNSRGLIKHYTAQKIWNVDELSHLLKIPYRLSAPTLGHRFTNNPTFVRPMMAKDFRHYLGEQILMMQDKITMCHTLELRAPYLDTNIVQFSSQLPNSYLFRGIHGKYILRKLASRYLPPRIAWRLKRGFSPPLGRWLREEFREIVWESIDMLKPYQELINLEYCRTAARMHMSSAGNKGLRDKIWSLIVLARWLDEYRIVI